MPATSQHYIYDNLSLTNSTLSTADTILRCTKKKTCPQLMIFIFFPVEKIIIPCSYCDPLSHLNSCTPTTYNLYLANALRDPALQRLLTFQEPIFISFCMLRDVSPRTPPPGHPRVEYFTSGLFCLQSKYPACACFIT